MPKHINEWLICIKFLLDNGWAQAQENTVFYMVHSSYLENSKDGAASGDIIPIRRFAHVNEGDGEEEGKSAHAKTPVPALVATDPYHKGHTN